MSEFGTTMKNSPNNGNCKEGARYDFRFINQFEKIPKLIMDMVNEKYGDERKATRFCIALILTNLRKYYVVAYSRRQEYYSKHRGKYYTKQHMINAMDALTKDKYCFNVNGFKDSRFDYGIASTARSYDKIHEIAVPKETVLDFTKAPMIQLNKHSIYNKWDLDTYISKLNQSKVPQSNLHHLLQRYYSHNGSFYAQLFSEAQFLNRGYFNKMSVDFCNITNLRFLPLEQVSLTRIFNGDGCGRWFQKGGMSYQQLSEDERPLILLNGQDVIELDYSAMHPHILYYWEGLQCPDNFYETICHQLKLPYNDMSKFVVKRIVLSSINASDEKELGQSINYDKKTEIKANLTRRDEGRDERPILYDEIKKLNIDFRQIVEAFKKVHPAISQYVYSASANKLMLEESIIMTSLLLKLKDAKIPALPMHDSVIFPEQHKDIVKTVMLDCYRSHTKFNITVK